MRANFACLLTFMSDNATLGRTRLWQRSALDLVFPPACPLCESSLPRSVASPCLCEECRDQVATPADQLCSLCGRERKQLLGDGRCPGCRDERHKFAQAVCLGPYHGALSEGIVRMKHAGQQSLTAALARELAGRIRETAELAQLDVFVPIPMHWRRRILRGAGTSQVLAESLARDTGLPISARLMKCTRSTQKQSTLSTTARKKNVRGAFRVTDVQAVVGLHVGLVDDTLTTGATANEAARVLMKAGAERVTMIVLARAASQG